VYFILASVLILIVILYGVSQKNKSSVEISGNVDSGFSDFKIQRGDYIYLYSPSPLNDEVTLSDDINSIVVINDIDDNFKKAIELNDNYMYMTSDDESVRFDGFESENIESYCINIVSYNQIECDSDQVEHNDNINLSADTIEISNNGVYKRITPEPTFTYNSHEYFITGVMQYTYVDTYQ
jgi:hypothetical protein